MYILLYLILFITIYYLFENNTNIDNLIGKTNINDDGYMIWQCGLNNNKNSKQKLEAIKKQVLDKLPNGYQFLDHTYYIKCCSITTFHRYVTSS